MLALLALTAEPELQVRASAAFVHPVWVELAWPLKLIQMVLAGVVYTLENGGGV